jgi:hypothetical protein
VYPPAEAAISLQKEVGINNSTTGNSNPSRLIQRRLKPVLQVVVQDQGKADAIGAEPQERRVSETKIS